jgi:hypothetical protein
MTGAAVERVREALAEHGCQPRGPAQRLRARCPVHESRGPTLAVSQGRTGALVKCHAQCETGDVLTALGLTMGDLYDEPRVKPERPWKPRPSPTPAEQAGQIIARVVENQARRDAIAAESWWLVPKLTADERVEQAEWESQQEAGRHYWRTLARWAALACDERYVREAHRTRAAWLARTGPKPTHEQFMVLLTRAEDLERAR